MGEKISIEHFSFESREDYDRAEKELEFIEQIRKNVDLTLGENAHKVYIKAVSDKMFQTVIGYCFLLELRQTMEQNKIVPLEELEDIPVKVVKNTGQDVLQERSYRENRFQRLYEGQRLLNKKFKIVIAALVILIAGFVVINFRMEYSIFTYFTNYKANMEEELINKYEYWQTELEEKEKKLQENEGQSSAVPEESAQPDAAQ